MNIEERKAKVLEKIKSWDPNLQDVIKENMENGLLCACNLTLVPYFGENEGEHGFKLMDGVSHGYDDCVPLERG